MDYEEDLLFSLFNKYRASFDELNESLKNNDFTREHAQGGQTLHRGFYCPSPVIDIIVGGCDRGRLVHDSDNGSPIDYLYLKAGGKLKIIDKYVRLRDNFSCLYQREFIIENGTETVAPIYRMTSDQRDLSFLSLCRYNPAGKIVRYLTFLPGFSFTGGKFLCDKNACLYYGEQFFYDEESGLLDSVISGQEMNGCSSEYSYRFCHDSAGRMVSYQRIENEEDSPLRMIPKKKRRLV